MRRGLLVAVGLVLAIAGTVFALQGFGILGGSVSVGSRAGGLFLTISNPNTASAFGDAGFGELDLSARWRIYSCFGRASLADLDPPGFLSRA